MFYRSLKRAIFICSFFAVFSTTQVMAEVKIAVVDVEKILATSKAAESIRKQVENKRETFLKQVKTKEDKLRDEQKEMQSELEKLPKEERTKENLIKKNQEYEKARIAVINDLDTQKKKLDKAYTEAMNKLTGTIFSVCQEIANERSIDLVITRQNIIVGSMSLDITKDVLDRMNKQLPNLALDVK